MTGTITEQQWPNGLSSSDTAVLLVNVGTPDSPEIKDVRRFLFRFLNDKRVIDLPWLFRKLLVNGIIVPFRAPRSARFYQQLWTDKGSPLLVNSLNLKIRLQHELGETYQVFMAMRYGKPGMADALLQIEKRQFKEIIVVPLYPQYASSTTGTVVQRAMQVMGNWKYIPEVHFAGQFYNRLSYIEAMAARVKEYNIAAYDHILFSYHGLPNHQVEMVHPGKKVSACSCASEMPAFGKACYKAACYETSRLLAGQLNLATEKYSVAFQSRFSKNWLSPFADHVIKDLAAKGTKRLLVVSPSFVADCLETVVEVGTEYQKLFRQHGGEHLQLADALNDHPLWIKSLAEIIREKG